DLVRGDADADAGAADHEAARAVGRIGGDAASDLRAELGIVDRFLVVRADVDHFVAELLQLGDEHLLQPQARVVGAGVPLHQSPLYRLITSAAFVPPKPKLFDIAWSTLTSRG